MTTTRAILDHLAGTRRTAGVALTIGAAGLALGFPAPAGAASTGPVPSIVTVVAPRGDRTLAARPLVVRVRAGAHAGALRARLNGRPIHHHFGPPRRGVRRLRVSASHGLRHGVNTLRVTVRARGRRPRRLVRRFRIADTRPLAAAGHDRTIGHGGRVHLNASGTRLHAAARTAAARPRADATRYRWRVVAAPRASRLRPGRVVARADTALLDLRQPGTYRLELAVTASDGRVGSDLTTVRVDPAPLLAVDTMAEEAGSPGIRVGARFYPAEEDAWLQVVVLDRSLGTLRSNRSYPCVDRTAAPAIWWVCASRVASDLGKLDATSYVIASAQPDGGGTSNAPHGAQVALAGIGVPRDDELPSKGDDLVRGTWSALGAIGNKDRGTVRHAATGNTVGGGRITGYLVRNNRLHYTFVSPERFEYSTQAEGSSASQNVVEVAGRKYVESGVGSSQGGFQVVIVDTRTLDGQSHWFATGGARGQVAVDTLVWMQRMLADANNAGHKLIVVASRGATAIPADAHKGLGRSHALYHALMGVADEFQRAGATRGAIFDMIDPDLFAGNGSQSLTFVGRSGAGAGWGELAKGPGKVAQGALNGVPLAGSLVRGADDYAFVLDGDEDGRAGSAMPDPGEQLARVVYQAPRAWPEAGNARREAAIRWVGVKLLGTDDPRGQYWTQEYTVEFWDGKLRQLAAPDFLRDLPATVDADAARWAVAQLATEIGWLEQSYGFLTSLARPYARLGMTSWADLGKVADDVQNKVGDGANQRANMIASGIFEIARGVVSMVPEVGEVAESLDAVYEIGMEIGELVSGESAQEPFSTAVADAKGELATRLDTAQTTLERQIFHVIAADYGKLSTVGLCYARDRACPGDAGEWQLTSDFTTNTTKALKGSLKTSFYAALMPAKYTLWRGPYLSRERDANKLMGAGVLNFPVDVFTNLSGLAQHARPVCRDMGDHDRDAWDVYALAQRTGNGTVAGDGPWVMHPPQDSVVADLFGDIDRAGYPDAGGLGADRETFFSRYFTPVTLDHFMYTTGDTVRWKGANRSDCDITE